MKAQELRIGNWVKDHGETGQQWPVSSINQNGFTAGPMEVFPAGMMHDWGIPLTAEWLEGFGFTKLYHLNHFEYAIQVGEVYLEAHFQTHDKTVTVSQWVDPDYNDYEPKSTNQLFLNHIKYVHQLQNLYFALTGSELELTKA